MKDSSSRSLEEEFETRFSGFEDVDSSAPPDFQGNLALAFVFRNVVRDLGSTCRLDLGRAPSSVGGSHRAKDPENSVSGCTFIAFKMNLEVP